MEIKQKYNKKTSQFLALDNEKQAGFLDYSWSPDQDYLTIDYVEVDPEFAGLGVGKKLVMAAVDFAREKQIKIKPICGFSASLLGRYEDLQDLIIPNK